MLIFIKYFSTPAALCCSSLRFRRHFKLHFTCCCKHKNQIYKFRTPNNYLWMLQLFLFFSTHSTTLSITMLQLLLFFSTHSTTLSITMLQLFLFFSTHSTTLSITMLQLFLFFSTHSTTLSNLLSHIRRAAVVRTDASANFALFWEIAESVVSRFHGEVLLKVGFYQLKLVKGRCFRLAWPTGRTAVGKRTSRGLVGIGQGTVENCWLPTKQLVLEAKKVTSRKLWIRLRNLLQQNHTS